MKKSYFKYLVLLISMPFLIVLLINLYRFTQKPMFSENRKLIDSIHLEPNENQSFDIEIYHVGTGVTTQDFYQIEKVNKTGKRNILLKKKAYFIPDSVSFINKENSTLQIILSIKTNNYSKVDTSEIRIF